MTLPEDSAQFEQPTGSPLSGEPVFLVVGKLRRPHGVQGEMVMDVITDFPERIRAGMTVYVGEERRSLHIHRRRWFDTALLVSFQEFRNPESAGELRNALVYVRADEIPELPSGEYYHHQLIGLRVVTEAGVNLGTINEILTTGANDVLVVKPLSGAEILLPMIDPVLVAIDLPAGEVCVRLLPGLAPDQE